MGYLDDILDRAVGRVLKRLKEESKPLKKYEKRVKNRNKLYKKRIKLGQVKKIKKGGR